MMRNTTLLFSLLFTTLFSTPSWATSSFCQQDNFSAKTLYIWPTIPFISGADYYNFQNAYSQDRHQILKEVMSMLKTGVYVEEPGEFINLFDQLYHRYQKIAQRNLGISLEADFRSSLDGLYRQFMVNHRRLQFLHVADANTIVDNARNNRPVGSIDSDQLHRLNVLIYGVYTIAAGGKGKVQVTIHMVDLTTGATESFSANNRVDRVMDRIAREVFHQYQKTHFPYTIDDNLTLLGTPNCRLNQKVRSVVAVRACRRMGGRLPSLAELEDIFMLGSYNGGLTPVKHGRYFLRGGRRVYLPETIDAPNGPDFDLSMINEKVAYYFCVR